MGVMDDASLGEFRINEWLNTVQIQATLEQCVSTIDRSLLLSKMSLLR